MSRENENMEMHEIESYDNLDKPVYKKKVTKKPQKSNKKLLAFTLITIAFIIFIILAYLNQKGNINSKIFEKNVKSNRKKLSDLENECKPGYKSVDGNYKINYSFKAIYITYNDDENIKLIQSIDSKDIKELIVEEKK